MHRNRIAITAIHQLQRQLQDAPEYTANEVSMVRAIQLLAPDIRAMKTRGYTMDQVAKMLTSSGVPIAATTLKSYLNRFTMAPLVKPFESVDETRPTTESPWVYIHSGRELIAPLQST